MAVTTERATGLVVTPHPLTLQGRSVLQAVPLRPGQTLAQLLAEHGVQADAKGWVVRIGGAEVPALLWGRTRPAHGQLIEAHRVPLDGDTLTDALRLVAIVALAYVTMGAGLGAGGLGGYMGFSGFTAYAINAAAFVAGSMIINKVLPPAMRTPGYGDRQTGTTYSLQGARNGARHFEPLGLLFGQVRVVPDYAAQPYSWFEGDDQFQYVQLHAGLNVHTVDELRIGDTPIDSYQGVTVGRIGFGDGSPLPTGWESVDTVTGALLDAPVGSVPGAWVTRTSSAGAVMLAVDLVGSVYSMNNEGKFQVYAVRLAAEYRALPSGAWTPLLGSAAEFDYGTADAVEEEVFGLVLKVGRSSTTPVRRTITKSVPAGQYEVRMRKVTANTTSTRQSNVVEWSALKSYQPGSDAGVARKVLTIAIKASGQLNGVLDQVGWRATSKPVPVWNGSAWVTQATSNPAAHFLAFARGEVDGAGRLLWGMGKPDGQIDLEGLKVWMLHCTAQGYRFDHWFDRKASCGEVLDAIAAAGLAAKSYHSGKLGVVFMAAGQPVESVVTMGNVKRGSLQVTYTARSLADELEVSWPDRDSNWLARSLRLLAPGVTAPRETAALSPAGVTTQAGALLQGRLAMAQNLYGRKTVQWDMDLEHLTFRRWSVVAMSHDLTQWGYGGRLRAAWQNLVRYSDDLRKPAEGGGASSPWTQFTDADVEVVLAASTAPDGSAITVSKVRCVTTGAIQRQSSQQILGLADNAVCVSYVSMRAAEVKRARLYLSTKETTYPQAVFDLAGGAVVSVTSVAGYTTAAAIVDEGGGWYGCWIRTSVLAGASTPSLIIQLNSTANGHYSGAVGDGILVRGTQVTVGEAVNPMIKTGATAAVGLTLDAEIPEGSTPHVALRLPGEAAWRVFAVQPYSGAARRLTLADAWPAGVALPGAAADDPVHDTLWIADFKPSPGQRLRVTDIQPQPGLRGARITAVPEPDEFWAYMASGAYTAPAAGAAALPVAVSNLQVAQSTVITTTSYTTELALTWDVTGPWDHAQVWGGVQANALALLGETRTAGFAGWRVERGDTVYVEVRPYSALGRLGTVASLAYTVAMTDYEPAAPAGLAYTVHPTGVELRCAGGEPIVVGYDWRVGTSFDAGEVIAERAGTTVNWPMQTAGTYTVWVAAVDRLGTRGDASSMSVTIESPGAVSLVAALVGADLQLDISATAGSHAIAGYALRYGNTWAAGTAAGTEQSTRVLRRVDWGGTRRWWVAAVDVKGNAGAPVSVDVTVVSHSAVTSPRAEVVDNNVLLYWGAPTSGSLPVAEYRVKRGATWAGGTAIGSNGGSTFTTYFEQAAGAYTYWVAAVDTAGFEGVPVSISATVAQPPDYVLRNDYNDNWSGITLSGMHLESGRVYGPSLGETIQTHFESRGWATPDAQIVAGYPLVFQPGGTSGYVERTMDYGTTLPATVITVTPTWAVLAGAVTLAVQVSYKLAAGDPWIDAAAGVTQVLASSFRYVKVRLTFTASGGDDLAELQGLNIKLAGKLKTDSGSGTANAADSGGTTVNFGVTFIDVSSIVVTPSGTAARYALYDFADVPNPTSFKVLLFDNSGTRVSGGFSWTARGY